MLRFSNVGYIVFWLFSCVTVHQSCSQKSSRKLLMNSYNKNLRGIMITFSYLDMTDEKGHSRSPHGRGREKKESTLVKLQSLHTHRLDSQRVLISGTQVEVKHCCVCTCGQDHRAGNWVNGMHVRDSLRPTTSPAKEQDFTLIFYGAC